MVTPRERLVLVEKLLLKKKIFREKKTLILTTRATKARTALAVKFFVKMKFF